VVGGNPASQESANAKQHGNNKTESTKMVEIGRFQIQNSFFFAWEQKQVGQSFSKQNTSL